MVSSQARNKMNDDPERKAGVLHSVQQFSLFHSTESVQPLSCWSPSPIPQTNQSLTPAEVIQPPSPAPEGFPATESDVAMGTEADCWMDLQPPKQAVCSGELLLSISYLPAANRLGVVVMKARGLHRDTLQHSIELWVKLCLKHEGTRLKKKQTRRVKHQMTPVWNEMLMLEVPRDLLEKSRLELELWNQVSPGKQLSLGRFELGPQAPGPGHQHWKQMLANPRKQIAMWHSLSV
ncbi:synaptotagmin-13 [Aplochiton taeniatus]